MADAGTTEETSGAVVMTKTVQALPKPDLESLYHRERAGMEFLNNIQQLELSLARAESAWDDSTHSAPKKEENCAIAATCIENALRIVARLGKGHHILNEQQNGEEEAYNATHLAQIMASLDQLVRDPSIALTLGALWDSNDPFGKDSNDTTTLACANVKEFPGSVCEEFVSNPFLGNFWRASVYLRLATIFEAPRPFTAAPLAASTKYSHSNRKAIAYLDSCNYWIRQAEIDSKPQSNVTTADTAERLQDNDKLRLQHLKQRADDLSRTLLSPGVQTAAPALPNALGDKPSSNPAGQIAKSIGPPVQPPSGFTPSASPFALLGSSTVNSFSQTPVRPSVLRHDSAFGAPFPPSSLKKANSGDGKQDENLGNKGTGKSHDGSAGSGFAQLSSNPDSSSGPSPSNASHSNVPATPTFPAAGYKVSPSIFGVPSQHVQFGGQKLPQGGNHSPALSNNERAPPASAPGPSGFLSQAGAESSIFPTTPKPVFGKSSFGGFSGVGNANGSANADGYQKPTAAAKRSFQALMEDVVSDKDYTNKKQKTG